jgi:hypothetical protein
MNECLGRLKNKQRSGCAKRACVWRGVRHEELVALDAEIYHLHASLGIVNKHGQRSCRTAYRRASLTDERSQPFE